MVLGKVNKLQWVKIQSTQQSIANSVEPDLTYGEVTNYAKLRGRMYWFIMQVKVLSLEMYDVINANFFHCVESSMRVKILLVTTYYIRGKVCVMRWNLRKFRRFLYFRKKYIRESQNKLELANDIEELSTQNIGKLCIKRNRSSVW